MKKVTIAIRGLAAAAVEQAARASFYGIHGNTLEAAAAMRAVLPLAENAVSAACPAWNSFTVTAARVIDTDGTPVPYAAEIDIEID